MANAGSPWACAQGASPSTTPSQRAARESRGRAASGAGREMIDAWTALWTAVCRRPEAVCQRSLSFGRGPPYLTHGLPRNAGDDPATFREAVDVAY